MSESKTVFISYSWDSEIHKTWARQLAERLIANGVQTFLDQWDVTFGESLTQFMDEKLPASDFVLCICTPAYAQKAVARQGGVGYEAQIISARIAAQIPRSKIVPIVRSGSFAPSDKDCALPSHLQGTLAVDMRDDEAFDLAFENLLRHVYGQPAIKRPLIGPVPSFDAVASDAQPLRLASFEIEHWHLASGVVRNELYPETFHIPEEALRRTVKPGDVVKLMFEYAFPDGAEEYGGERMWVEVTSLSGPYYVGRLRNHPFGVEEVEDWLNLEFDSEIVFLPEHVIDINDSVETPQQRAVKRKRRRKKAAA